MSPRRALAAAALLAALVVAVREVQFIDVRYDRFHVPAFDGHVYLAMTEHPRVFTVAPWGYRILTPWLVAILPVEPVSGFFWVTAGSLAAGGLLLFLFLRRLGHGVLPALLGLALYGVSGPVGESIQYQFLAEPLTFTLEMAFLLALVAGADAAVVALLAVLGVLAKEFFVLLLPAAYLLRRRPSGDRIALGFALRVALPAVAALLVLRLLWVPHIVPPLPAAGAGTLSLAVRRFSESWPDWRGAALLMGLTPLAALGALRRSGRPLLPFSAYLLAVTIASPFFNPVTFAPADIPRLLLYALPGILPLALAALGSGDASPQAELPVAPRWLRRAAIAAVAAFTLLPPALVDRYRRVDLQGKRDALLVLAVCRGTLETAADLAGGGRFVFDPEHGRFSRGVADGRDLAELRRVRWFLRDGWGPRAQRADGRPAMQERAATLLVPCLRPRDLVARLALEAPSGARVGVFLNDRRVGDAVVGPSRGEAVVPLPAALLFRGDNVLSLVASASGPGEVRLDGFTLGAGGPGA